MNLPTFIIAGAQRSGTTFLYELFNSHPEVYMAKPRRPEPKFYLVDEEYAKGLDYYSKKYFAEANGYKAIGEKSTNYLENPRAAHRIHCCQAGVQLIFMLRNPIERAFSNYLLSRKHKLETLAFEEAITREAEREATYTVEHRYVRPFSYVSRGMYAKLLEPYRQHFDRAQIKVILLDDFTVQPEATAQDLFAFVGVSNVDTHFNLRQKLNTGRKPDDQMTRGAYELLRELFRQSNKELEQLIGRDLAHWSRTWPD